MDYKEKLVALLDGLGVQNIDELLRERKEVFFKIGEKLNETTIKKNQELFELRRENQALRMTLNIKAREEKK